MRRNARRRRRRSEAFCAIQPSRFWLTLGRALSRTSAGPDGSAGRLDSVREGRWNEAMDGVRPRRGRLGAKWRPGEDISGGHAGRYSLVGQDAGPALLLSGRLDVLSSRSRNVGRQENPREVSLLRHQPSCDSIRSTGEAVRDKGGCHAPASRATPLELQEKLLESWDRVAALSRATLERQMGAILRGFG
jgi:hypothetical protein